MEYLKSRDGRLGEVTDQIGRIRWTVEPDLFSAIVHNIVSQPQDADGMPTRKITKVLFEKYRRRLSPCGSVASFYFWMVAGGEIPELTDPAPKQK